MSKLKVPQLLQQAEQFEKQGNLTEMEKVCQEIVAIRQDVPKVWHLLGIAARGSGKTAEAIEHFRKSLTIFPDSARVLCDLASALIDQERVDEALPLLTKARSLKADSPEISLARGKVLLLQQKFAEAQAELKVAVEKMPNNAEARLKYGNAFRGQGMIEQALMEYQASARADGNYADAFVNLGAILYQQRRVEESLVAYGRAVQINPRMFQARNNLGVALNELGHFQHAIEQFQAAVEINPQHAKSYHGLGHALRSTGAYAEGLEAYKKAAELNPQSVLFGDSLVYAWNFPPFADAKMRYDVARGWAERFADPWLDKLEPFANSRDPARRLKIGYVSADFRHHPVMFQIENVIRSHNREQVEVFCYSNLANEDQLTDRIHQQADQWRPISNLLDEAAARLIRQDGIDILVDLSLHCIGNRLTLFAHKPAPVQVTWLGYPGTTGLKQIDYRLTDKYLDPPERSDEFYTERSCRLEHSYTSYDPLTPVIPSVPSPAIANGYITFGCQNAFSKINDPIVSLWGTVLKAVPNSRMIIQADAGPQQQRLAAWFGKHGVSPQQFAFVPQTSRLDYLKHFQRMDIMLDTYPFCGGTTTLDALWMGVPFLSLCGKDALSRIGLSVAANLGLAETLVVTSPQQFVEHALAMASDVSRLDALRQQILPRLQQSPLMDYVGFAANLEAAYREMWRTWCGKK